MYVCGRNRGSLTRPSLRASNAVDLIWVKACEYLPCYFQAPQRAPSAWLQTIWAVDAWFGPALGGVGALHFVILADDLGDWRWILSVQRYLSILGIVFRRSARSLIGCATDVRSARGFARLSGKSIS